MSSPGSKARKRLCASALRIPENDQWYSRSVDLHGEFFKEPETVEQQVTVLQRLVRDEKTGNDPEFLSVVFLAARTPETAILRRTAQGALQKMLPQRVGTVMWGRLEYLMSVGKEPTSCVNELSVLANWQPHGLEVLRVDLPKVFAYFDKALSRLNLSGSGFNLEENFETAAKIFRSMAMLAKYAEYAPLMERCASLIKKVLLSDYNTLSCRLACGICLPEILLVMKPNPDELYRSHVEDFSTNPLAHACFIAGMINVTKINTGVENFVAFYGELLTELGRLESLEDFHKSSPFALTVSRTMVQWTQKLINCKDVAPEMLKRHGKFLMTRAMLHVDHFVDAVQHQGKALMKTVVDAMGTFPNGLYEHFLNNSFASFLESPFHKKSTYAPLTIMAKYVVVSPLINRGMVRNLYGILTEKSMLPYVQDFVREVGKKHLSESPAAWKDVWLEPFLEVFVEGNAPIIENLVPDLFKLYPQLADEVLKRCRELPLNLLALRLLPLEKLLDNHSIVDEAQWSTDEKMRLALLQAMTDCPKSREPLNPRVIPHLKVFLRLNCSTQSQALRQNMFSSFKKLIRRMHDSGGAHWEKPGKVHPVYGERLKSVLQQQRDFMTWMFDFCVGELRPGCNFFTRSTILMLLELLSPFVGSNWTLSSAATLLQCIKDTYESNKTAVMKILANIPPSLLPYAERESTDLDGSQNNEWRIRGFQPANRDDWIEQCVLLTRSARPPDCVTAAYMLRIISARLDADAKLKIIKTIRKELSDQIRIAEEEGLVEASSASPMYGALTCLRTLLDDVLRGAIPQELVPEYQEIFKTLIKQCKSIANIASPLVTNASPEGQLRIEEHPELEKQFKEALLKGFGKNLSKADTVKACAVASQMFLLCCWRSHKEVSLTFGVLADHLDRLIDQGILPISEFVDMSTYFMDELSTVRHRGAFEQAYVGFSSLCSALWRSPEPDLNLHPRGMLYTLLGTIQSGTVSYTRRSAGLPFIVQALVVSEPDIHNGSILGFAMRSLLAFAESYNGDEKRVHALNVLKALFKDTRLGETIMAHVAEGMMVALEGFDDGSWAVRNSATLLFSALITRIFGVNRSKQDIERKNCLSGPLFFLRYPELNDFLFDRILRVYHDPLNHTILVPIFLLFGRLYPSLGDTRLEKFTGLIDACSESPLIAVRQAAAKAFAMNITSENQHVFFKEKFDIFTTCEKEELFPDTAHGYLLEVEAILDLPVCTEDFKSIVKDTLIACWWFLDQRCSVVAALYFEVLMRLGIRHPKFSRGFDITGFSNEGLTNLQRVVAKYKCETRLITLGDVVTDHHKMGLLQWSLQNYMVLPEIMLTIVANPKNEHPDVQELAFELAARELHTMKQIPFGTFIQAFLAHLSNARVPTVAASIFSCIAKLVVWLPVDSAPLTVGALRQYSAPNQDPKMRSVASELARKLLETFGEEIFVHAHKNGVFLDLCEGLINLVVDNDHNVRNQVVLGLSTISKENLKRSTPLDSLLVLCSGLCASKKVDLANFLVRFALAAEEAPLDVEVDEQPFEKSELNTFYDSLVIAESCRRAVMNLGITEIDFDESQFSSVKDKIAAADACDLAFNRQLDGDLVKLGQYYSVLAIRAGRLDFLDEESCPISNAYFNQFKCNS